jgi:hypothetical protein
VVEGQGFDSLAGCATGITPLRGLEVEIDELRDVVDHLVEDGRAVRKGATATLAAEVLAVGRA